MTDQEFQELQRIRHRMGVILGVQKVNYKNTTSVYHWGMRDGMQIAFDIIDAWYHKLEKSHNSEVISHKIGLLDGAELP